MNNDIKEILKDMDLVANKNKVPIYYSQNDIKIVLDYITNLRQLFIKIAEYTDSLLKENEIYSEYGKKILEMCDIHDG